MTQAKPDAREPMTTMAFRHYRKRRRQLEVIQAERGHGDLSDTLRDAVDTYIDLYLRESKAA